MTNSERFEEKMGDAMDVAQFASELVGVTEQFEQSEGDDSLTATAKQIETGFRDATTVEVEADFDANVKSALTAVKKFEELLKKASKSEALAEVKDALRTLKREIKNADFSA